MKIQFNTDKNSNGTEEITAPYITQIEGAVSRFRDRITRIEVHLSNEDGSKNGIGTMRCMIEARIQGRQPVAITHQANTHRQAVTGALDKLRASLNTIFDKLSDRASSTQQGT